MNTMVKYLFKFHDSYTREEGAGEWERMGGGENLWLTEKIKN